MKRVMVMGIMAVLVLSVFTGMAAAQTRASSEWGFKTNINLGKEFGPYLDVGYDTLVSKINQEWANMNGSYEITDHDSDLKGELKFAGAMKQDGNNVNFEMGNYVEASIYLNASGTFPYAKTVEDIMNDSISPKKIDSNLNIEFKHKLLVSGTAVTDGNGNVSSVSSNLNYEMSIRVKGKNVPIPIFLYAMLQGKASDYNWVDIEADFSFLNYTNDSICFQVSVDKYGDYGPSDGLKISNFHVEGVNAQIKVLKYIQQPLN